MSSISQFLAWIGAFLLILTLHEAAHAWVATRLGDPTPEREGRLSLNPFVHMDLLGFLMMIFAGFGWGKPVPVQTRNFDHPYRDEALVALAGPVANFFIAILAAIPLRYAQVFSGLVFFSSILMDLSLMLLIFNLLPFPPLDGSKWIPYFLPVRWRALFEAKMEQALPWFVAFMIADLVFLPKVLGVSLVWSVVSMGVFWVRTAILVLV